jgi:hypothetical protein
MRVLRDAQPCALFTNYVDIDNNWHDTSNSAAYQVELAQPPAGGREDLAVSETRRRLTENQAR